jgi:hypothetical protein
LVSKVWDLSSDIGPSLPIGWGNVQILRQRRRKTTNAATTILGAIQAASESNFINEQLYFTFD